MNLFQKISSKKLIAGLALLIVAAAIPLTVYIAQKQQEIRQRASGEETSLYFTQGDCSASPVSQIFLIVGQQSTLSFCLDTGANPISGFDVTVQNAGTAQSLINMTSLTEGEGAQRFPSEVFKRMESGAVHFTKVTTDTSNLISGKLRLAMATFTPTTVTTSGNITVSEAMVTSATSPTALSVSKPTLTYSIGPSRGGSPLSATITGPTAGTSQPLEYIATASGQNVQWVRIYQAQTDSDITQSSSWTLIAENHVGRTDGKICTSSTSCTTSGTFTPTVNGSYYISVNASDEAQPCSGNPRYDTVPGWRDCGPNDLITLTVDGVSTGTQFDFTLDLTGIGNPGNSNPKTNPITIQVELFNSNNEPLPIKTGTASFSANLFKGTVDMGSPARGNYTIKVKTPKYLKKRIPGIQTITAEKTTPYIIPSLTLIVGDANNDNKLDITDFNMIYSCFGTKSCNDKDSVDFDDDGKIDGVDYNLFVRSLSVQQGD